MRKGFSTLICYYLCCVSEEIKIQPKTISNLYITQAYILQPSGENILSYVGILISFNFSLLIYDREYTSDLFQNTEFYLFSIEESILSTLGQSEIDPNISPTPLYDAFTKLVGSKIIPITFISHLTETSDFKNSSLSLAFSFITKGSSDSMPHILSEFAQEFLNRNFNFGIHVPSFSQQELNSPDVSKIYLNPASKIEYNPSSKIYYKISFEVDESVRKENKRIALIPSTLTLTSELPQYSQKLNFSFVFDPESSSDYQKSFESLRLALFDEYKKQRALAGLSDVNCGIIFESNIFAKAVQGNTEIKVVKRLIHEFLESGTNHDNGLFTSSEKGNYSYLVSGIFFPDDKGDFEEVKYEEIIPEGLALGTFISVSVVIVVFGICLIGYLIVWKRRMKPKKRFNKKNQNKEKIKSKSDDAKSDKIEKVE